MAVATPRSKSNRAQELRNRAWRYCCYLTGLNSKYARLLHKLKLIINLKYIDEIYVLTRSQSGQTRRPTWYGSPPLFGAGFRAAGLRLAGAGFAAGFAAGLLWLALGSLLVVLDLVVEPALVLRIESMSVCGVVSVLLI